MKNYKLYLIILLSALSLTSCIDDDAEVFNTAAYVVDYPNVTGASKYVLQSLVDIQETEVELTVPVRLVSNNGLPLSSVINGSYEVDLTQSTAIEGTHFELLNNANFTIPAGQGDSTFGVKILASNIDPLLGTLVIALKLTDAAASGYDVNASGKAKTNTVFLELFATNCPITESLAGTHSVVFTAVCIGNGDGPADCDDTPGLIGAPASVVWTEDPANPGVILIGEASFGYYGYLGIPDEGQGPNVHFLTWACSNLIFDTGIQDSYSDPFTYDVVSVVGPIMTIHFTNTWGDNITFELTREGGANWPPLLQS